MSIKVTQDRTQELVKALRALTKNEVMIGVPADNAERPPEAGEDEPINNALIGYLMEYGRPEQNLPERPHLVPGIESVQGKMIAQLRKAGEAVLSGDLGAIDRGHHAVGLLGQSAVQKKITDGPFAPLSPRTLKKRRQRGRTGEKPLLDTGAYRRSITYVVRGKGK